MSIKLPPEQVKFVKEEIRRLMMRRARVKGEVMQSAIGFLRRHKGEDSVQLLERAFKDVGFPFRFNKLSSFNWYQERYFVTMLFLMKILFNWRNESIFEMGKYSADQSIIVRTTLSFISLDDTIQKLPSLWEKLSDKGTLELIGDQSDKSRAKIRLHGYDSHQLTVVYLRGFLTRIIEMVVPSTGIEVGHTKGVGDNGEIYTDFIINWG